MNMTKAVAINIHAVSPALIIVLPSFVGIYLLMGKSNARTHLDNILIYKVYNAVVGTKTNNN